MTTITLNAAQHTDVLDAFDRILEVLDTLPQECRSALSPHLVMIARAFREAAQAQLESSNGAKKYDIS